MNDKILQGENVYFSMKDKILPGENDIYTSEKNASSFWDKKVTSFEGWGGGESFHCFHYIKFQFDLIILCIISNSVHLAYPHFILNI